MIRIRTLAALVVLGTLAACGKDAAGPSTRMHSDEAQTLALGLAGSAQSFNGSTLTSGATVQATAPFSIAVSKSLPCPRGGTLAVDGTTAGEYGNQPLALIANTTATIAPSACAYRVKAGTLTVTGAPNVAVSTHIAVGAVPNPGVDSFTALGTLIWNSSDGRNGTCAIDFTATGNFRENTRSVRGTICGNSVNFTGSIF